MMRFVNSLGLTLGMLSCPAAASAGETCVSPGFIDKAELTQCVQSASTITGSAGSYDLQEPLRTTDAPLVMHPRGGSFDLETLAYECVSAALLDRLCMEHPALIALNDGVCPLGGIYAPPSEARLKAWGLGFFLQLTGT